MLAINLFKYCPELLGVFVFLIFAAGKQVKQKHNKLCNYYKTVVSISMNQYENANFNILLFYDHPS